MPSHNMPLRHKDYFELKANGKKPTQDELSVIPHLLENIAFLLVDASE